MKRIIEEKGVRATINYEIIDQEEFNEHLDKERFQIDMPKNAPDYTTDGYMATMFTIEQAQKEFDRIEPDLENDNEYSLIELYIFKCAYKAVLEDFKSGKKKSDYEAYKEQQEYIKEEDEMYE